MHKCNNFKIKLAKRISSRKKRNEIFEKANFITCFFTGSGGGCKNIATSVSIEIERVAQEQLFVCSLYVRLRYIE